MPRGAALAEKVGKPPYFQVNFAIEAQIEHLQ
jgi:hypothetical protein